MKPHKVIKEYIELENRLQRQLEEISSTEKELLKFLTDHAISIETDSQIKDELVKMAKLRIFFNQYKLFVGNPTTKTIEGFFADSKDLLVEAAEFEENRQNRLASLERTKLDKTIQIETDHKLKVLKNQYRIDDLMKQSNEQALLVSKAQKDLEESMKTGLAWKVKEQTELLNESKLILSKIQNNLENALQRKKTVTIEFTSSHDALNDWYEKEIDQFFSTERILNEQLRKLFYLLIKQLRIIHLTEITHIEGEYLENFLKGINLSDLFGLLEKKNYEEEIKRMLK